MTRLYLLTKKCGYLYTFLLIKIRLDKIDLGDGTKKRRLLGSSQMKMRVIYHPINHRSPDCPRRCSRRSKNCPDLRRPSPHPHASGKKDDDL